jgi:hypothetical protein
MEIRVSNELAMYDVPKAVADALNKRFTILNPAWQSNEKMGRWQGDTDEFLHFAEWQDGTLYLPRGDGGEVL